MLSLHHLNRAIERLTQALELMVCMSVLCSRSRGCLVIATWCPLGTHIDPVQAHQHASRRL